MSQTGIGEWWRQLSILDKVFLAIAIVGLFFVPIAQALGLAN